MRNAQESYGNSLTCGAASSPPLRPPRLHVSIAEIILILKSLINAIKGKRPLHICMQRLDVPTTRQQPSYIARSTYLYVLPDPANESALFLPLSVVPPLDTAIPKWVPGNSAKGRVPSSFLLDLFHKHLLQLSIRGKTNVA